MRIKGKAYWARILGKPHTTKFNKDGEWSIEVAIDDETVDALLKAGVKKSFIKHDDEKGNYLKFSRNAFLKNGEEGKPFQVVDSQNQPWPQNVTIGNGSIVNVIVSINERERNGEKYLRPNAIAFQVWDLVKYEKPMFETREGVEIPDPTDEKW